MRGKDKECSRGSSMSSSALPSREQAKTIRDLRESLELIVSGTGLVHTEYGGFMIEVIDFARFPYGDVITTLIKHGFEIWITLRDDRPQIIACVKGD
ncbi:MAG: hypothetical protein QXF28_03000 [Nitrososphaerota archaeon]